jgi:hypothetical protein
MTYLAMNTVQLNLIDRCQERIGGVNDIPDLVSAVILNCEL